MASDGDKERDAAGETGWRAGRAVSALGVRLLRLKSVRRAIRRGVEEAREPVESPPHPDPPPPGGTETSSEKEASS
jgi:hypothetical protein